MNTATQARSPRAAQPRTSRPVDEAEYEDLCACRCSRLPGIHSAGQCSSAPAAD